MVDTKYIYLDSNDSRLDFYVSGERSSRFYWCPRHFRTGWRCRGAQIHPSNREIRRRAKVSLLFETRRPVRRTVQPNNALHLHLSLNVRRHD